MRLSVVLTCDGFIRFWKSRMRRHYVGVIVGVFRTLWHDCRGEEDKSPDVSSRPMVYRHSVSWARGSTASATAACSSMGAGAIRSHHTEGDTI